MIQIVHALSCNLEESFKKLPHPDPAANQFQHLTNSSMSTDIALKNFHADPRQSAVFT